MTSTTTPLSGRTALVTGGSRGIGRAVAVALAEHGADVAVSYVNDEQAAEQTVTTIEEAGRRALAVKVDLSDRDAVAALYATVDEQLATPDIVVNNAGTIAPSPIAQTDPEAYDATFDVNARGTFFSMQEAAQRLGDGGRIVNVSSVNVQLPSPGVAAYAGSKAAVEQFTRVGAKELGPGGVTVNAVSPGATDTDMLAMRDEETRQQLAGMSPFGRLGQPEDIADVVTFLASEDARWITGQVIQVGGGVA